MLNIVPKGGKICELGVLKGDFSEIILAICEPSELVLVDVWPDEISSGDVNGNNLEYFEGNVLYEFVKARFENDTNVQLRRQLTLDALHEYPDNYFDMIYIDADHRYEGARDDIALSYQKLRHGGYLMGHDYSINHKKTKENYNFGVKKAVDEFCNLHKQQLYALTDDGCMSFAIKVKKIGKKQRLKNLIKIKDMSSSSISAPTLAESPSLASPSSPWEDALIISSTKTDFTVLDPVNSYLDQENDPENQNHVKDIKLPRLFKTYIKNDNLPLPLTEDREGYHGERHFDYWLSGLSDFQKITLAANKAGVKLKSSTKVFDFGCASGRVLRHFAQQSSSEVWGCDISENHVNWCNRYLSKETKVFQNTSLPHLQIEDNFFDIVYAMSVFTHIESFETSWLAELKRIIKPGGIAYVTVHDETSWKSMPLDWGAGLAITTHPDFNEEWLKDGFPGEKFISRWHNDKSYSSNVFYKLEYLKSVWSKFFVIIDVIPKASVYQTVLVLQKR